MYRVCVSRFTSSRPDVQFDYTSQKVADNVYKALSATLFAMGSESRVDCFPIDVSQTLAFLKKKCDRIGRRLGHNLRTWSGDDQSIVSMCVNRSCCMIATAYSIGTDQGTKGNALHNKCEGPDFKTTLT